MITSTSLHSDEEVSMKTKRPRHLFRSRRARQPAQLPVDHGKRFENAMAEVEAEHPHWRVCLDKLFDQFGAEFKPGHVYRLDINHAAHCPALAGDLEGCRCTPTAELFEAVV
jgi:hypothetical protein